MIEETFIATTLATLAHLSRRKINMPTPEGEELGRELARLADKEMEKRKANFPNHIERCATCAFRRGTIANGSPQTLRDAVDAIKGDGEFMCHERENHQCVGYAILK